MSKKRAWDNPDLYPKNNKKGRDISRFTSLEGWVVTPPKNNKEASSVEKKPSKS